MALIANNVVVKRKVKYTTGKDDNSIGNIKAGKIIDVTKDKINSEAAAVRPLIKNPVVYEKIESESEPEPEAVEVKTVEPNAKVAEQSNDLIKHKPAGRSRYTSDMLTVE